MYSVYVSLIGKKILQTNKQTVRHRTDFEADL